MLLHKRWFIVQNNMHKICFAVQNLPTFAPEI